MVQVSDIPGNANETEENNPVLPKKLVTGNLSMVMCNIMVWNVWSVLNEEKLSHVLQVFEDTFI